MFDALSQLETRLGLTRGDVTVALFLSMTALVGWAYTTMFTNPRTERQQQELYTLIERHDSILDQQQRRNDSVLTASLQAPDSAVPEWKPLSRQEIDSDEVQRSSRHSSSGRRRLSGPIDINSATKAQLVLLPGVGEKTAQRIIDARTSVPFSRPEDIMKVKGIGPKKFEKLKPWIEVP